jgi:hypothetical protein
MGFAFHRGGLLEVDLKISHKLIGGLRKTYCVADGILLLAADDGAAAHGGVKGALALDDGLALAGTAADGLADLGDLVPVRHIDGC